MNNVKLPQPPSVCPPGGTLSDIKVLPTFKGRRINKAKIAVPSHILKSAKKPIGLEDITTPLPDNFSWRDNQYVNIETPRDQGQCGSCWAFSSTTTIGDRYAIKFSPDGKIRGPNFANSKVMGIKAPKPSVLWTLSCSNNEEPNGCDGGFTGDAITFFGTNGTKPEACWSYSLVLDNPANITGPNPQIFSYPCLQAVGDNCCESCCENPLSKNKLFSVKLSSGVYYSPLWFTIDSDPQNVNFDVPGSILNIKKEIYNKGPVVSSFLVYNDFFDFWNNQASNPDAVYICDPTSGNDGGHAIVIVGWGINSKGIHYWLIRNSWGDQEGDGGYFKMAQSSQISNKANWNGIDVPIITSDGQLMGGALSMDIPDTMDFVPEKFDGNVSAGGSGSTSLIQKMLNSTLNYLNSPIGIGLGIGIGIILVVLLLFLIFKRKRRN